MLILLLTIQNIKVIIDIYISNFSVKKKINTVNSQIHSPHCLLSILSCKEFFTQHHKITNTLCNEDFQHIIARSCVIPKKQWHYNDSFFCFDKWVCTIILLKVVWFQLVVFSPSTSRKLCFLHFAKTWNVTLNYSTHKMYTLM